MNKNEDFKLIRQQMKDEAAKLAIEKEKVRLKWEEEYWIESIQKAIDKYPLILENFKNSTDFLVDNFFEVENFKKSTEFLDDEFFEVENIIYNATSDNMYFTLKVAELLKADGFEVILRDVDGINKNQPPYKIVAFKLK